MMIRAFGHGVGGGKSVNYDSKSTWLRHLYCDPPFLLRASVVPIGPDVFAKFRGDRFINGE